MDSHLLDRFQKDMTDMLRRLRAHPAQVLWRSYSPSHFGGEQGSFILDKKDQGREQQDKVSGVNAYHRCDACCGLFCRRPDTKDSPNAGERFWASSKSRLPLSCGRTKCSPCVQTTLQFVRPDTLSLQVCEKCIGEKTQVTGEG